MTAEKLPLTGKYTFCYNRLKVSSGVLCEYIPFSENGARFF